MESILFKGDDSSSGESDSEPQTTTGTGISRPATSTGLAPRGDVSTTGSSMSQSEISQRLKSMYSPASKAVGGTSTGSTGIGSVLAAAPSQQAVSSLQTVTTPAITQQLPQHRPQQQVQQQQKAPNATASYRPAAANEPIPHQQQQQQRGIQHQNQRNGNQPQLVQQRSGGGITHQQQVAPLSGSVQHPAEQQSRPRMNQMQAPSIPHRPSNRLPHQQQQNLQRHVQQGQPQGNLPLIRNPPPSAPTQSQQQGSAPRSSNYIANVSQQQQQQAQLSKNMDRAVMDRGVMEKKQKERFLIFTKVLMVRINGTCCYYYYFHTLCLTSI